MIVSSYPSDLIFRQQRLLHDVIPSVHFPLHRQPEEHLQLAVGMANVAINLPVPDTYRAATVTRSVACSADDVIDDADIDVKNTM